MSGRKVIEVEQRAMPVGELRVDAGADGAIKLSGYAAKFGVRSEVIYGSFREVIQRGAFAKNLPGADVRFLVNHDPGRLLARTKSQTLTVREDEIGLRFEATLPATTLAKDTVEQIKRGDLDAMSFGFRNVVDSWGEDENGFPLRTLLEVRVFDVSIATFPAYQDTELTVRSFDEYQAKKNTSTTERLRRRVRLAEIG